jgi:type III secretion protein N (ATPase)
MYSGAKKILTGWKDRVASINPVRRSGRLEAAVGATLLATLPGARLGERVLIGRRGAPAEVAGFQDGRAILLPLGDGADLSCGLRVRGTSGTFAVPWSRCLLGRVLDAQARPMDRRDPPRSTKILPVNAAAPSPVERPPVEEPLATGIRALDGFATLGRGQRMGLFAGPGLGKSTLLAQIAKGTQADCIVLALVGERGREVSEFIRRDLGPKGLARSVVVCATSDRPAGERARVLPVATAIAEGFRSDGRQVLLLVDSLTRHARALREIALSSGEPPGRRGFPPSVFDRLAAVVERTGNDGNGSITALYTVLTEGEPEDDPLGEEVKALLDGHITLSADLARAGCYPAVDPCASLSRLMNRVVSPEHLEAARRVRELFSVYESRRDLIAAGAYEPGSDADLDRAIALRPAVLDFVRQQPGEKSSLKQTLADLLEITAGARA